MIGWRRPARGADELRARGGRQPAAAASAASPRSAPCVLVVIAIAWLVLGGDDDGYNYDLIFETGGQLVEDNEVLIGGAPVGTVNTIELTDNGQAEVAITVNRQLHEGTKAVIRQTSLSGIANRYVSITPGPDNAPALDDGAIITEVDTTTPVDLDQLFNALAPPERKGLQDVIQGSATTYAGRGQEANETYRFLSPAFVATDQLIQEVNRDAEASSPTSSSAAAASPAPSPSAATTSSASSPTPTRRSARSPPRTTRSTARSSPCRRPCARPTPPSSTFDSPSTTLTHWSRPRSRPPRTWRRSCAS